MLHELNLRTRILLHPNSKLLIMCGFDLAAPLDAFI